MDAIDFKTHLDGCFWSCEHKVVKPDAAYLVMLDFFSIDPRRAVFIDDTPKNLVQARRLGLHTILYKSQQQAEAELAELLIKE